ncbi:MAG TPA: hypothetical protein VNL91_09935 [Thermoanaerobaculia bacterium]|nr:hypothetical protein [Thermoanaerobaculia bacterium]
MNEETPAPKRSHAGLITALVLIVAAFLAGLIPPTLRARRISDEVARAQQRVEELNAELVRTRADLEALRLRAQLGDLMLEAERNNFGNAAAMATRFFDGVARAASDPAGGAASQRRQVFAAVLARRDEISADLARADAAVKQKLTRMYIDFGAATQ